MNNIRSENAVLHEHEIEAIKINQEIIKRMASNSQNIKSLFLTICVALITLFASNTIKPTIGMFIGILIQEDIK